MDFALKLPLAFGVQDISKSAIDETSLPNTVLTRQAADRFIDMVVDTTTLMKEVRVERVNKAKGQINKLDLAEIVTEGAQTTSRVTTHVPSEKQITYDTEKYRSAFDLKSDFLEDNPEGTAVRDRLLAMFTKRIGNDIEIAAIQGDDDLTVGDDQSQENNLLGVNDGFSKILRENVPNAQQIDANGKAASADLYFVMKSAIPAKYRILKPNYAFITPSGPSDEWAYEWAQRGTTTADQVLATGLRPGPWGIPMLECYYMPEDLTFGSAGTDGCEIWLTPLKNLVYFVQRDITIEFDRQPRNDAWEVTIHFRVDFEVEDPDLVVIAKNVSMSGDAYTR